MKKLSHWLAAASCSLATLACSLAALACPLAAGAQGIAEKLDTLITAYHDNSLFSGTVLVAGKQGIIFEKGYGERDKAAGKPNDKNTIFQIGSITKQFTSALILQLEEQRRLSLTDRLSKYIPDYPKGDSITIEQLLTHESGIWNYTNDAATMMNRATRPVALDSLIDLFKYKPLDFPPGSKYQYSNSGYILLGFIIQKLTGRPWFTVMRENIFRPLHMDHSGFDFAGLRSTDKAVGYNPPTATTSAPIIDSSVSFSAGSLYTTVEDLYAWDRALYGSKILSQASLQKAFTPHLGNYGLGWATDSAFGMKVVEHGGGIPGFVSFILRVPEDRTCIIIFDNTPAQDPGKMAGAINALLHAGQYTIPRPRPSTHVDSAILKDYTGKYEIAPGFILTISLENGKLMGQATGQGKVQLFAEKENVFYPKEIELTIEFVRGADNSVTKLLLTQGGQVRTASRIK